MTDIDLTDSRHILPGGYDARRVTEPPALPAEALAAYELAEAHEELGLTRVLHAAGALNDGDTQAMMAAVSGKMGRALRILTGGALVLALAVVGLVAAPSGRAEAMEAPQPDPVAAQSVRVVLGAAPVTVWVRATVYTPTAPGWWCASLWTAARGRVGGTCSIVSSFPIPVTIDPRTFPIGRSFAQVVDDATDVAVGNVTFDARRPSRFGVGTFIDQGRGDLFVSAPLTMYSAPLGRYIAQQYSPVQVQVAGRHGWVTVATLTTTRYGVASGVVHLGGGVRVFRVARPAGATVWSTVGTAHRMSLLTEPVDVI